jgi:uncharacterized protein (DUF2235 family)
MSQQPPPPSGGEPSTHSGFSSSNPLPFRSAPVSGDGFSSLGGFSSQGGLPQESGPAFREDPSSEERPRRIFVLADGTWRNQFSSGHPPTNVFRFRACLDDMDKGRLMNQFYIYQPGIGVATSGNRFRRIFVSSVGGGFGRGKTAVVSVQCFTLSSDKQMVRNRYKHCVSVYGTR